MFCQSCGAQMDESGMFCDSCGAKKNQGHLKSEIQDTIKESAQNALSSFKHIAINPVGHLQPAYDSLDKKQKLGVGVVFTVMFNLLFTFGLYLLIKSMLGGYMGSLPVGIFIKLILAGFVPFVGIVASSALLRQIFHSDGGLESDVFIAGVALIPTGICMLLSGIVGAMNFEVIAVLSIFAMSYTILIVFTGFTRILKISDAGAAIAVPICLLVSAWLSKIIVTAMIPRPF